MSAQAKPDRHHQSVLKYAPPRVREQAAEDETATIQPQRIRNAPQPDHEEPFSEDAAITIQPHVPAAARDREDSFPEEVAIRRVRRTLEPERVPEPSYDRVPRAGMFIRFAMVAMAAVIAFALVAFLSGMWPSHLSDIFAFRGPESAPVRGPRLAGAAMAPMAPLAGAATADVPVVQPQAPASAALPSPSAVADVPAQPQATAPAMEAHPAAVPSMPQVRGVTDSEIKFGMSAPFSGPARELGRQMKLGIETAFDRVNDVGGINGRQLHLLTADDGYEPARTDDAMKHLYDADQVFGIIGNVGTPTAAVAAPFALDRKMLFFGAFTGANLLRRDPPDRYVFNYRASYAEETSAVVRYLVKVRGLRPEQIAVFAQQDSYGDSGYAGVAKAVRQLRDGDGTTVLRLNYQRNTIDVDSAVKQLREHKGIKAVVMVATYRAAAKFIEKTRPLYQDMIYTNVSFVGSTELANELMLLGPRYANGVIVTQVVPAVAGHSTTILEYKSALAKHFPGEAPDYVSLEGYVTANVLIEALKRVGPQVDTERLVNTLEGMHGVDLGLGAPMTFGRDEHQASHKVWGTQLDAKGNYQEIDLE